MYVGEGKTLPDIPTKYCRIAANLTFASGRETEITGLFDRKSSCTLHVSLHLIWLLPTQGGVEEKDR